MYKTYAKRHPAKGIDETVSLMRYIRPYCFPQIIRLDSI